MKVEEALLLELFSHPESKKFRESMGLIIDCARMMHEFILNKCKNLREKIESTRQEYEGYLQFSPEDMLELEREQLKFLEDGINGWEYDLKRVALWSGKRSQIEDDLDDEVRVELDAIEGEVEAYGFKINSLIEENLQLLFKSLFIAVYSSFEMFLINLCNDVRESESLKLKLDEVHGKGIKRSLAYLKKVSPIDFPDNTKELQIIMLLNKIRNQLVHDPEHEFLQEEENPKLLDYFWLQDPYQDDPIWDVFGGESIDIRFSLDSLYNIVKTFNRFVNDIDRRWIKHNQLKEKDIRLKEKFQQGPKHKK